MGLAVVHGIVENHEGAVLVESEPEKGIMVTVYFPSVDEDTIPEAAF
jgi:signal transduction histidine kinase